MKAGVQVVLTLLCVGAFYGVFVTQRIDQHGVRWFVHLGHEFLTTSKRSDVIRPSLGWQSPVGYDGQYYFGLAADPVHARYYMPGSAGYVYSRAFYPAVSRAVSYGSVDTIPYAMLVINLVAVGAGTLAIALWLCARGASPWPAALFGLYPGLIFTVFRDLTEPLAFALVALAVLAFDERRPRRLVLSATLFALALLTRETVAPFALAAAGALVAADRHRAQRWRSWAVWRRAVLFAVGTCGPLLIWRQLVAAYVHEPTQETGSGGWAIPLHGILSYWPFDPHHRLIVLTVVLPAFAAGAVALVLLWSRRAQLAAGLLLVNVLLYVVFLPTGVDVDYGAAGRAAIGVVLAAIYCLPLWRARGARRALVLLGTFTWSIGWYLLVSRHYGLDGIDLITS